MLVLRNVTVAHQSIGAQSTLARRFLCSLRTFGFATGHGGKPFRRMQVAHKDDFAGVAKRLFWLAFVLCAEALC